MKIKTYDVILCLKIIFVLQLLFSNYSLIYGQDDNSKQDALVSISFSEENKKKTIRAVVTDQEGLPVEELDLYFYVQRSFSLLPIGDVFNTTDENGVVEVEFPNDLPADGKGNVEIVIKIFEADMYNDLSLKVIKKWGIPTTLDHSKEKRSLWAAAANAPISLVIITSLMVITMWVIFWKVIFILYKISKIKPLES